MLLLTDLFWRLWLLIDFTWILCNLCAFVLNLMSSYKKLLGTQSAFLLVIMDRFAKLDKYLMVLIEDIMRKQQVARISILGHIIRRLNKRRKRRRLQNVLRYSILDRMPAQIRHMNRLVRVSDTDCLVNLRMDRNAFGRLCGIFRQLGIIRDKRFLCIEEQVAIFLGVLAHHKKNRIVRFNFMRSGHTVSKYVHEVMAAVIKLHNKFLVKPEPINAGCVDWRWKHFQVRMQLW